MAMSAATLKAALKAALISTAGAQDNDATDGLAEAIATAVVGHITANATVTVAFPIPVQVVPAMGTGATTATGTGTVT